MSRANYAVYHAACALLARVVRQARTHRGVQRLLSSEVVRPGWLDASELARFGRLQERRGVADYRASEEVEADEASALVADARAFVSAATQLAARMPSMDVEEELD